MSRGMGEHACAESGDGPQSLLLVANNPAAAEELSSLLPDGIRLRHVWPSELPSQPDLVDLPAVVVRVDDDEPSSVVDAARALRELPAGRNLLLLLSDSLPEPIAQQALSELAPAAVLPLRPSPVLLRHAVAQLMPPNHPERRSARVQHRPTSTLLGVSAALRDVIHQIKRIAPTRLSVLILGETGTGKELVARAIHEHSPRGKHPFVAINCGAIPETLLEAELFGVRRGAFTGAERDRRGLFEEAEGGTLFLDEIGDMPATLQPKLLRALETKEIRAIGADQSRCVDVRILAATHRDLETLAKNGEFRQDLLFRINTATIHVPPLRRRPVDIPFLAQHFAEEFGAEDARRIVLHDDFVEALSNRQFPGNVRELRNTVERAIALAEPGQAVRAGVLGPDSSTAAVPVQRGTLREQVRELEVQVIRNALVEVDGNRTRAAQILGLSRQGLRQKIGRYGL
jgi:transcriptional regulator with PAS, ATPase and Fis domain